MKTLIAVVTCHPYLHTRAHLQRETWATEHGADVRFFTGCEERSFLRSIKTAASVADFTSQIEALAERSLEAWDGKAPEHGDQVCLPCDDTYLGLKWKVRSIARWATEHGYDHMWKVDDDVYLRPERLLAVEPSSYCGFVPDVGRLRGAGWTAAVAWKAREGIDRSRSVLGPCVGFSRLAMQALTAKDTFPGVMEEDLWAGAQLAAYGFGRPVALNEVMRFTHWKGKPVEWDGIRDPKGCAPNNSVIACWEYTPQQMAELHGSFK